MKPGQKLSASIIVHRQAKVISVPNQVIFQQDGEQWVYVKHFNEFTKQRVKTDKRSLTKSLITSGIAVGDEIALVAPEFKSSI
jgi:hypothetical protein